MLWRCRIQRVGYGANMENAERKCFLSKKLAMKEEMCYNALGI